MKPPPHLRPHRRRSGGQRWDEHNIARRTAILEAALALIEEHEPGAEISTQQIADRAGLARSVVYRQFRNREDLDARAREYVFDGYLTEFEEILVLDPAKTVEDLIFDVMLTVVRWTTDHPNLYRFAQQGPLPGHPTADTLTTFRHRVADTLWRRFASWTTVLAIDITPYRPLAYGIVGLVEGVISHHLSTPPTPTRPTQPALARLLTTSTWHLLAGHAADQGHPLDRTTPLSTTLATLLSSAPDRANPEQPVDN
ncbi:TetR/AcrR family transcriptional regulator [Nocardia yunnanensis]|uniref:TetR/AcrR family transcriptional regulator n=1 Tax=Nocardia yunnanensis TaxID=2382165 RepID=A0A386Z9B2_9NOCA|nr:TetR/AcrR family transcriptional regulator [Nocardia yunnanensis]AYF74188.1 TetR/AcrR family transcriptional regulator [Nocardia yunnanensis]